MSTTSTVSGGNTLTGSSVVSGETLTVSSGGTISLMTVNSGGNVLINSGGVDSSTTILAGGSETVSSGGSATGDQIYGTLTIISTGSSAVSNETVYSGGVLNMSKSATVSNTTLSGGATVDLLTGAATLAGSLTFVGTSNTLVVTSNANSAGTNGDVAPITGFTTTDNIDILAVASSAATLSMVISGGNTVAEIYTGGSIVDEFVFSGTAISGSLSLVADSGGHAEIEYVAPVSSSGSSSSGTSGGVTSVTTSTASGAYTETSGNTLLVANGGSVSAATIDNGGSLIVSGGKDAAATISLGGAETVAGGSATGDQIYGVATVNGGSVTSETVENGGSLIINAGVDSSTTILAGGNENVSGSATGDQIYGTQLLSFTSAVATNETVYAGGNLDLFLKNTFAIGTVVSSGGALNINGNAYASNTVLSGGGVLDLQSPKAEVTGSLTFAGGGNILEITDTTSAGYGVSALISGFSSTDEIDITSAAFGGSLTLSQTVSGGNTVAEVLSGGAVVETFTFAGSSLDNNLTLVLDGSGGVDLEIKSLPVTTSVTTSTASGAYTETAGNTLLVLAGGSVSAATIDNGGFLVVNGGGDVAATIMSGGLETISLGTATGDQILGSAIVSGGSVGGETVLGGGALQVGAGASAINTALSGGGLVNMASTTAALTGSLTFSGGGNTLEASAIASNGFGDQAVISGFSTSDKIDVTGISPTGATLSFATNGAGDEVATVSGAGGSESFVFSSPAAYNANTMALASDGNGGVDLVLKATPVVAFTSLNNLETNQATYVVNGTVTGDPEAVGTTVSVMEGNTVVGTGVVGANGYWSADVAFTNDDGANTLTAKDTDLAGVTGVTSQPLTYNVNTTAAAFTAGNLVISLSGDSDGSDVYGDNQASPLTLEQITTSGQIVSQTVLPQTTTTNANGVTEYAISDEYGSSSEGTLELSGDGHSLVIAGYGVNADAYNEGGAAVYGNSALGQSTSIEGGQYTAVPRVIADVNADGVVDTSTALYDVYNTNNPRSVATVDGSSFYISGQGVKGDDTQGLFYAQDGATSATEINDATDTRVVEIYNGQIYVSADSTQGVDNISSYSDMPTSATAPTVLGGINGTVALNGNNGNTVNGSAKETVNLSPESYFFANADTLYIADSGNPKAGGVGDGGLQKWVYNGTSWTLDYTLSTGLNLINNDAGSSSNGDTGLIGLTGQVEANGTVEFYATTEPLNDLGATSVVAITDTLSSTTGAGETFTTILTASSGENIRGIAFAPTAYAPTITGAVAGQTTTSNAAIKPFSGVTIGDANSGAVDTLTITLRGAGGTLSGLDLNGGAGGVYSLSGTAAAITSELEALMFTPIGGAPNTSVTTTFTLTDTSSANATPTVNSTTTVTDSDPAVAPTIAGAIASQVTGAQASDKPFSTMTIADPNSGSTDTITIHVTGGGALSGAGLSGSAGVYTLAATTAANATQELDALVYTPAANPSQTPVSFAITDQTSAGTTASAVTTVTVDSGPKAASGEIVIGSGQSLDVTSLIKSLVQPGLAGDIVSIVSSTGQAVTTNGSVVYTAPSSSGTDSFTYTVEDEYGDKATATVSVVIEPKQGTGNANLSLTHGDVDVNFASGNDNLILAGTGDLITIGSGNETISGGAGSNTVTLGAGNDTVSLTGTGNSITIASGNETVMGGSGSGTVVLGAGNDNVYLTGAGNSITIGSGNEMVTAGSGSDSVTLGSGNSTVILAGSGNSVTAGPGNDIITGGSGSNVVTLGLGTDNVMLGGAGNVIQVGSGANTISGGAGSETITAGSGKDVITLGGTGNTVTLNGSTATVSGGKGNDKVVANGGVDTLSFSGSGSSAALYGTISANITDYGSGLQIDIGSNTQTDTITGFGTTDHLGVIDLLNGAGGYSSAAAVVSALQSDGHGGTLLSLGTTGSIDFSGVAPSKLTAANFKVG